MFGATVFWISGFTALPPIYDALTTTAALNGAYWAPQVIGGSGFIVSGILFMIETQQKWYLPAPKVLGWHIGVWNLLGVSFPSEPGHVKYVAKRSQGYWFHALRCPWFCYDQQRSCVPRQSRDILGIVVLLDWQRDPVV
jgi:hypothetical protein